MVVLIDNLGWLGFFLVPLLPWAALVYPVLWLLILAGPFFIYLIFLELREAKRSLREEDIKNTKDRKLLILSYIILTLPFIFYIT